MKFVNIAVDEQHYYCHICLNHGKDCSECVGGSEFEDGDGGKIVNGSVE